MPIVRPARQPPEPGPYAETPPLVVKYGWRDSPYHGTDRCQVCAGWGCKTAMVDKGAKRRPIHETCRACQGTGRDLSPTKGKGR